LTKWDFVDAAASIFQKWNYDSARVVVMLSSIVPGNVKRRIGIDTEIIARTGRYCFDIVAITRTTCKSIVIILFRWH
jgi:hypothetical protein